MLYTTALFVFGLRLPDIKANIPNPNINVYVTQPHDPTYFKEAFDLSEEFLRIEVGLNVRFWHVKKTGIPTLDDLNHLAISEIEPENMARIEYKKRRAGNNFRHLRDFIYWLEEINIKNEIPFTGEFPDFLLTESYDGLSANEAVEKFNSGLLKALIQFFPEANGIAYIEDRIAYVLSNAKLDYKGVKNDACDLCKKTYGYQSVKTSKKDKIKLQAKNIIHEFSHLTGLWHPDIFIDDDIDQYTGDQPNGLSEGLFHLGYGKYGFTLNQFQKDWMRGFFNKEKPYHLFRKAINQKGKWDNKKFVQVLKKEFNFH